MISLQEQASLLDEADALSHKIEEFCLPQNTIYLDGNSLGPLTKSAQARAQEVVQQQWGQSLISSWNSHDWISLPSLVGSKIAKLVGAVENSVVCCDSISVNLFKILSAAVQLQKADNRHLILSQNDNFPTDLYMAQGLSQLLGTVSCELLSVASDEIESTLETRGSEISIMMLSHVNFKNGAIFDIAKLTQLAHEKGVLVVWDLAHSAGVLPLELSAWDVDFAVGCTYKYLNGGPGSPAFIYAAPRLLDTIQQPLSGWMGHKNPFAFEHDYDKNNGIEQFLSGTPSIISMSVLDAALNVFDEVSIQAIRDKSLALNKFFQTCIDELIPHSLLGLACVKEHEARGSQVSFEHEHAYAICQALISQNVIADFRAPNVLRLGFSPLFLSFQNVYDAAKVLQYIIESKRFLNAEFQVKQKVT